MLLVFQQLECYRLPDRLACIKYHQTTLPPLVPSLRLVTVVTMNASVRCIKSMKIFIPHLSLVVGAIANYTTQVVDTSLSATQRQQALMFLGN